jgi:phosphoglycerate kinase
MNILKLTDIDIKNKRVLIREDFNVPINAGVVSSDARIRAALPTLQYALDAGAKIIILSHLGRPNEGEFKAEFSLAPVAAALSTLLNKPVKLATDWINGVELSAGEIILCENVRWQQGEKKNDPALAQKMAALCDVFVMDAFATAHRAEASTYGVAQFAPIACAGLLLSAELDALHRALQNPTPPLAAIIGGAKVSTKLSILENLLPKISQLIVGGGIANTFLAAQGFAIGKSLYEADLIPMAQHLLTIAQQRGAQILLPVDVIVAQEFSAHAAATIKAVTDIADADMILDIGPQTAKPYAEALRNAGTILWNGPVGVFEFPAFAAGTKSIALAIAASNAFSIAGGGDTLAAIEQFAISKQLSYISTGGGAFLEFMEGKELPAIKILQQRATAN